MWTKIITFGIGNAFDREKSSTFVHKLKLKMTCQRTRLKLREKVKITISPENAKSFMEKYQLYQQMSSAIPSNSVQNAITNTPLLLDIQSYPWMEFIARMREGGVDAAMRMVVEKAEVIQNLPANANNVLGITFEELQIAKIMAEVARRSVPLDLIEGDGRGAFTFEGKWQHTPEYVDAVFYNRATKEYFAVQFKYSDRPEYLVNMMNNWRARHQNRQPANIPEALELNNVQLVGPRDVVNEGGADTAMFQEEIRLGFEMRSENTETTRRFLHENQEFLQYVTTDKEYQKLFKQMKTLNSETKNLQDGCENIEARIRRAKQDRQNLLSQDPGADVRDLNSQIEGRKRHLDKMTNELAVKETELNETNQNLRSKFRKKLVRYKTDLPVKALLKDVAIGAGIGALIDGVIALVVSCDTEIRRYTRGDISWKQCAWQITKTTGKATVRGAVIGGGFSAVAALTRYATMAGWSSAPAISYAASAVGPVFLLGTLGYQTYAIMSQYRNGDLTTAQMEKAFARTGSVTTLSTAGMIGAATLLGGPVGLLVGAGLVIAVGIGDHFLGDSIWGCFITEDPQAVRALVERKRKEVTSQVLEAAYDLFDLTKYATEEELRDAYRAALLTNHPDRGGSAEIFIAVYAAYTLITEHRH